MNNNTDADTLQIKLGNLAAQYRSSSEGSPEHYQALKEYYAVFRELYSPKKQSQTHPFHAYFVRV